VCVAQLGLTQLDPLSALQHLQRLLDLYDRGMREPLPIACRTSAAYAQAVSAEEDPLPAARGEWETDFHRQREDREPEHQLVHGGQVRFEELLREPPATSEQGPGWDEDERTRFGRLARRLWDGLLSAESVAFHT